MTKKIQSVKGPVEIDSLGLILPHEHLFTDLRGPQVAGYAQADPLAVVGLCSLIWTRHQQPASPRSWNVQQWA